MAHNIRWLAFLALFLLLLAAACGSAAPNATGNTAVTQSTARNSALIDVLAAEKCRQAALSPRADFTLETAVPACWLVPQEREDGQRVGAFHERPGRT